MSRATGGSGTFDGGDWPKLVIGVLIERRREGDSFDMAWFIACARYPPAAHGYGRAVRRPDATESPIAFFKRHACAAYYNAQAERYCSTQNCVRLAPVGERYCDVCGEQEEDAA